MAALDALGMKHEKVNQFKLTVTFDTPAGEGTMTAQAFILAPGLHLLDFRRGQSDYLTYYKKYCVIKEKLAHIVDPIETSYAQGEAERPAAPT